MFTRKSYYHLHATALLLGLLMQNCDQTNGSLKDMVTLNNHVESDAPTKQMSPTTYGPFNTYSRGLVTFQQSGDRWCASLAQEVASADQRDYMNVGCAEDIAAMLKHLQGQPKEYIKSRVHVLSPSQSPTGTRAVYLGRLGLMGGMDTTHGRLSRIDLYEAACSGDLEGIKYLIEGKKVNVNAPNSNGVTALHIAAGYGHLNVIRYLIDTKALDPNIKDQQGNTALHHAVLNGKIEAVKYLIDEKAVNPNTENTQGLTALHTAALKGWIDIVKYLVDEKKVNPNIKNQQGLTALHNAALSGHIDILSYLIDKKKADPNARDQQGRTALHCAAFKGQVAVMRYLINKEEVNQYTKDQQGCAALHTAAFRGKIKAVKHLIDEQKTDPNIKNNQGLTALHGAAGHGYIEVVKYLIEEKKVDPNIKNNQGLTALHGAAGHGYIEVVKYLIEEKKVDPNTRDNQGRTALHVAASNGKLEVMQYLIDEKAVDPNIRNNQGITVLHIAAGYGHIKVVKYLVDEKNMDPKIQDHLGRIALHNAAFEGHIDVAEYLIDEKKVNPNTKNKQGFSALHGAAGYGRTEVVKYLVDKKKVNPNTKNDQGRTALHIATLNGQIDVMRYLINEKKIDLNIRDNDKRTVLHIAALSGQLNAILYLLEEEAIYDINAERQMWYSLATTYFREWVNFGEYIAFISLADALLSQQPQLYRTEAITRTNRLLQLNCKGKFCAHNLSTSFLNRFKSKLRKKGMPEAMWLDASKYFATLPSCIKDDVRALVDYIHIGKEKFILHASGLVGLLEKVSPTPLNQILYPPKHFKPYNPEDLIQQRTIAFYARQSPAIAALITKSTQAGVLLTDFNHALCNYLRYYLATLRDEHGNFREGVEHYSKKPFVIERIREILTAPDVVYPTQLREQLKQTLKILLTPDVASAVEELSGARETLHTLLYKTSGNVIDKSTVKHAVRGIENALSKLGACAPTPAAGKSLLAGNSKKRKNESQSQEGHKKEKKTI
ncbi:MAG: ankyrin repeat domain-containing protein [Bacteroidota bacterium]